MSLLSLLFLVLYFYIFLFFSTKYSKLRHGHCVLTCGDITVGSRIWILVTKYISQSRRGTHNAYQYCCAMRKVCVNLRLLLFLYFYTPFVSIFSFFWEWR